MTVTQDALSPHNINYLQAPVPLQIWGLTIKGTSSPSPPADMGHHCTGNPAAAPTASSMEPQCTGTVTPASDIWWSTLQAYSKLFTSGRPHPPVLTPGGYWKLVFKLVHNLDPLTHQC